jgi:3-phosphoshikimate 1-carboxyvinyltransferase
MAKHDAPKSPLAARRNGPLKGDITVPGDKSISHRSLMFGALAVGETRIDGLLEGEDVLCTAAAMRALGAEVTQLAPGSWSVHGAGIGGLREPDQALDLGNSGTAARLLMGLVATHPITTFFTGDASLSRRPMARVTLPLEQIGARIVAREGGRMPLAITGATMPVPIRYRSPVPSAQVKSAVLLAGLNTPGETTVVEAEATRDHTERLLTHFGATVRRSPAPEGGIAITVVGQPELIAKPITVPADPSSAAFIAVAALSVPGSQVTIRGVGMNPSRDGLYRTLAEMGADIAQENRREVGGEPVADLVVRGSKLKGVVVPAERAPTMIDEYPILAIAAACAEGRTVMQGLAELRVKESDRLSAVERGLIACSAEVEAGKDSLTVMGRGGAPRGGGTVVTDMDHRIAMAFLVLGLAAEQPVTVDDGGFIDTSFPGFAALLRGLGGRIDAA